MRGDDRGTRALLHALTWGASIEAALSFGASSCSSKRAARRLEEAAAELAGREAYRSEILPRVPLEPEVVQVLLARAPREQLAPVARLALEATRSPRTPQLAPNPYVLILPLIVLYVIMVLDIWVLPKVREVGLEGGLSLRVAELLALIGLLVIAARYRLSWRLDARRMVVPGNHRVPVAPSKRLFWWLAAGQAAGVPPGAIVSALEPGAPLLERWRLHRLRRAGLGAASALEAVERWAAARLLRGAPGVLGATTLRGETPDEAIERLAKLAPEASGVSVDPILASGIACTLAAAVIALLEVFSMISSLGGAIP